jgi:heme exporter protein D
MSEFFAMGGYAFYVWTSYLLVAVVLTVIVVKPLLERRRLFQMLASRARLERRES